MKTKFLLIITGCIISNYLYAEHNDLKQSVYSKKSKLTVDNLNKATEIIRDPTQISGSFRNALKNISPPTSPNKPSMKVMRPVIRLNALVAGAEQNYSAMLKIENEVKLVKTGHRMSIIANNALYEIERFNLREIKELSPPVHYKEVFHYLHKKNAHLIPRLTAILGKMKSSGRMEQITRQARAEILPNSN